MPTLPLTTRRALLLVSALFAASPLRGALAQQATPVASPVASVDAPPQPDCAGGTLTPTPAQTAGPFYTPNAPETDTLREPGMPGTPLTLAGWVVSTDCGTLGGAVVDIWQADAAGVYDNAGYRLRGRTRADSQGRWRMETVVPGEYPGRTPHVHVKVTAEGAAPLTTQLYLPDEPGNTRDRIFDPALIVDLRETPEGKVGFFTFVLSPAP